MFKFLLVVIIQSCALGQTDSGGTQDEVVCITRTGEKYHLCSCQYLRSSKIEIDLSDAEARYTPCSVCKPGRARKLGSVQQSSDNEEADEEEAVVKNEQPQRKEVRPSTGESVKSKQCSARTKSGTRCKRTTTNPSGKCFQHDK